MLRVTALSAAAAIALSAFAATAPAEAAFHLIRWEGTGACQIWDESIPTKPIPSNYKTVSKPVPTFAAALAMKDGMMKKGACKL
ncbi:hypothetical protein [Bradyrhizobium sp. AUGA SZCCT0431]|uniref:hypothetical protein n=1 Tax=Bradyrhizobium sp. AUGA SZCCT0431 TaxID=2807674 RepID=UPI001BA55C4A|nr:hypothetical protein [Bradyrhizobium sp. AUGA SZCCT0431]MBR1144421.1 hypothetical protein [Bradyrhizobium sp. AUGA SZCCT0431]